jgi:hypothetical protein
MNPIKTKINKASAHDGQLVTPITSATSAVPAIAPINFFMAIPPTQTSGKYSEKIEIGQL